MAYIGRLPGPNADLWDWQLRAACRGEDSALFFHPENERGEARAARDAAAKAVCATCPVVVQCARHALRVREPYGVWGGMSEDERAALYERELSEPLRLAAARPAGAHDRRDDDRQDDQRLPAAG
jgi:WhiB family redox-sensing transcriptional regulator